MDNSDFITVYPNPSSNYFFIEHDLITSPGKLSFELFNVNGDVVKVINTDELDNRNNPNKIKIKDLTAGVYFLKSIHNNKVLHIKLIKM
jgi:hypothetical protein